MATRRNPLMSAPGVSIETWVIDMLHCVWLGVAQVWLVFAMWLLIDGNGWEINGLPRGGLRDELSMERMREELCIYYRKRSTLKETQVQDLSLHTLGKLNKHATQPFKGSEAKHLVGFVVESLTKHQGSIQRERHVVESCLLAGQSLELFTTLTDKAPMYPDPVAAAKIKAAGVLHIVYAKASGVKILPKHHQLLHLVHSQSNMGNPRRHANWIDESLNKTLSAIAGKAHSSVWEARILCFWDIHKKTKEVERCGRVYGPA